MCKEVISVFNMPATLVKDQMKELGVKENEGVYVSAVPYRWWRLCSWYKKGDIITKVNNTPVSSGIEMSAQIASFRPNDKSTNVLSAWR